jgi:hypothetical protein
MLLALATLTVGFVLDDYGFILWLDGSSARRVTPFDLYEFADADRVANFEMVRSGPWPWWADLDLKVRFFRPLSSALIAADHALFGHAPLGYHVHAVVWYLLLLVVVGLLLRAMLSPRIFALAFLLYAISGTHAQAVGWISSRHMLVAAVPAVAGLAAHVRYRERGFRAGRWLRFIGMLIGLAGGEAALGGLLYWMAYEAVGVKDRLSTAGVPREARWRERAPGVALPLGLAIAYYAVYRTAGYGAAHSDAYFEPSADPGRFAAAAAVRVPLLLGELVGGTSSELAMVTFVVPFVVAGVLALVAFAMLLRAIWPTLSEDDRRSLRWLGAGAVLATIITVGGFPGTRLLVLPKIGGSALTAAIILQIGRRLAEPAMHGAARLGLLAGRGFLVFAHTVYAPVAFLGMIAMLHQMGASDKIDRTLDPWLGSDEPPSGKPSKVVILAASDPVTGIYAGAARGVRAPKTISAWVTLSMARATHHIERTGDRTLVIDVDPGMLYGTFEVVFRAADRPLHRGDKVDLDDAVVTVRGVKEGHPTSFAVDFRTLSLDEPTLKLLIWQDAKLVPVHLAKGERLDVPWTPGPTRFF